MEREIIYQAPDKKITVNVPDSLASLAIDMYLLYLTEGAQITISKKGESEWQL